MENSGAAAGVQKPGALDTAKTVIHKINRFINAIGMWAYYLRKFVMAAPVVYGALKLAAYNQKHLPAQVGLNLQATGEFAMYISRYLAVMGPLALTAACLFLMFCSRKATYAWAISVFTLALPLLLLLSNLYPA